MLYLGHRSLSDHGSPGRVLVCVCAPSHNIRGISCEILQGWRYRAIEFRDGINRLGHNGRGAIDIVYPIKHNKGENE